MRGLRFHYYSKTPCFSESSHGRLRFLEVFKSRVKFHSSLKIEPNQNRHFFILNQSKYQQQQKEEERTAGLNEEGKNQTSPEQKLGYVSTAERALNVALSEFQCQLTTPNPDRMTPNSSLVPHVFYSKSKSSVYFSDSTSSFKKEFIEEKDQGKKNRAFMFYDFVFLTHKISSHNTNLLPSKFNDSKEMSSVSRTGSFSFGATDIKIVKLFENTRGRFPPRSLFSATNIELIPYDSNAFHMIWKDHFERHPHVSSQLRSSDVHMFRVNNVTNAFLMGLSGEMSNVPLNEFIKTRADPLVGIQKNMIDKMNSDEEFIQMMCKKGFGLDLVNPFVFSINRYGLHLLGQYASNGPTTNDGEWNEFFLDYGKEITKEAGLRDFLMKIHQIS